MGESNSDRDGTSSSSGEGGDTRGDWCPEPSGDYGAREGGEGESSESGEGSPGRGTAREGKRHVQQWHSWNRPWDGHRMTAGGQGEKMFSAPWERYGEWRGSGRWRETGGKWECKKRRRSRVNRECPGGGGCVAVGGDSYEGQQLDGSVCGCVSGCVGL